MPLDDHRQTNLRNWEDRVAIHAASQTYDLAGLAADPQCPAAMEATPPDGPARLRVAPERMPLTHTLRATR